MRGGYEAVVVARFRDIHDLNTFVKRMLTNCVVPRTSNRLVLSVVKEGFTPRITGRGCRRRVPCCAKGRRAPG